MLQIPNRPLNNGTPQGTEAEGRLNYLQGQVDVKNTFSLKVARAGSLWGNKKKSGIGTRTFDYIKARLIAMCVGVELCNYCEQNEAIDIEHIAPKSLFPQSAFVWENYLLVCKNCNSGYKLDKAYVFDPVGSAVSVLVVRGTVPSTNDLAIIDPRVEDPMDLMVLDLNDFNFYPRAPHIPGTRGFEKVENTINNILEMNDRGSLIDYRKKAFANYKRALSEYVGVLQASTFAEIDAATIGDPVLNTAIPFATEQNRVLTHIKDNILTGEHPTVFYEMIRQAAILPQRIQDLITASGAATW